jgi:hypothetical protein
MRGICEGTASGDAEGFAAGVVPSNGPAERPSQNRGAMASVSPPPPSLPVRRWVPHRKAELIAAVRGGSLSLDAACRRYDLTIEEFLAWQHGIDLFGMAGLRVYKPREGGQAKKKSVTGKKSRLQRGTAAKKAQPGDDGPDV